MLKSFGNINKQPAVIATSGFITEYVASAAKTLGVKYLMLKPADIDALIERMQMLFPERLSQHAEVEIPAGFEMIVAKAVRDMGIPANIKGYFYLIEAVKIAVHHRGAVLNMTQNIYIPVAAQFATTAQRVSSAITRAITIGWDRCLLGTLEDYFGSKALNSVQFPANAEFITVLAEHVRAECDRSPLPVAAAKKIDPNPEMIRHEAAQFLQKLSVPKHLKGYQFLQDAIVMAVEDMDVVNAMSKVVYPVLAQKYGTTPHSIEHAMRYAIIQLWDLGDLKELQSFFGYTVSPMRAVCTIAEFIALAADTIQRSFG